MRYRIAFPVAILIVLSVFPLVAGQTVNSAFLQTASFPDPNKPKELVIVREENTLDAFAPERTSAAGILVDAFDVCWSDIQVLVWSTSQLCDNARARKTIARGGSKPEHPVSRCSGFRRPGWVASPRQFAPPSSATPG